MASGKPKLREYRETLSSRISDILSLDFEQNGEEQCVARIAPLVRLLDDLPKEPEPLLFNGLLYFCKRLPMVFRNPPIFQRLLGFLGRSPTTPSQPPPAFRKSNNSFVALLSCNLLYFCLKSEREWPLELFHVYVDDMLGPRSWVDDDSAALLVERIASAFQLQPPPDTVPWKDAAVRQGLIQSAASQIDAAFSQWQKNSETNLLRNILTAISVGIEHPPIRALTIDRIFSLFSNSLAAKFFRLLAANLSGSSGSDLEIVLQLLHTKDRCALSHQTRALYTDILSQLVKNNAEYPRLVFRHILVSEYLKEPKPQPWIQLITSLCNAIAAGTEVYLAQVFLEFSGKANIRPVLASILQKIIREGRQKITPRYHFNLSILANALVTQNIPALLSPSQDGASFFPTVFCIVDMLISCCVLSVPTEDDDTVIRPTPTSAPLDDAEDPSHPPSASKQGALDDSDPPSQAGRSSAREWAAFRNAVATIQAETLCWLHDVVLPLAAGSGAISPHQLTLLIKKILFLQSPAEYFGDRCGNPYEKQLYYILTHQIPALEDTLLRITTICLGGFPLFPADALSILDQLVLRTAHLQLQCAEPILKLSNRQLLSNLMRLSRYPAPTLPDQGDRPLLVISWFWQIQLIVLVLVAFSPDFVLDSIDQQPSLLNLIEMIIMQRWTDNAESIAREASLRREEISHILALEQQILNSPTLLYESSSLLLPQLMLLQSQVSSSSSSSFVTTTSTATTSSPPPPHLRMSSHRLPPPPVIDRLRFLDAQLQLQFRYCRIRNPDFFSMAMSHRTLETSPTWLLSVVESDPELLDSLPATNLWDLFFNLISKSSALPLSPNCLSKIILRIKSTFFQSAAGFLDATTFLFERLERLKSDCRPLFHQILFFFFNYEKSSLSYSYSSSNSSNDYDWLPMAASRLAIKHPGEIPAPFFTALLQQLQRDTHLLIIVNVLDFIHRLAPDRHPTIISQLLRDRPLFLLWSWSNFPSFRTHLYHFAQATVTTATEPWDSSLQSAVLTSLSLLGTFLPPDDPLRASVSRCIQLSSFLSDLTQYGLLGPTLPSALSYLPTLERPKSHPASYLSTWQPFLTRSTSRADRASPSRLPMPSSRTIDLSLLFDLSNRRVFSPPHLHVSDSEIPSTFQTLLDQRSAWLVPFLRRHSAKLGLLDASPSRFSPDHHLQSALFEHLASHTPSIALAALKSPFLRSHFAQVLPRILHSSSIDEALNFINTVFSDAHLQSLAPITLDFVDVYYLMYGPFLKHAILQRYHPSIALDKVAHVHPHLDLTSHPFAATLTDHQLLPPSHNSLEYYSFHLLPVSAAELDIRRSFHRLVQNLLSHDDRCQVNSFNYLVRLARSNPSILLDNFRLLLSTLEGKTDVEVTTFISREHHTLLFRIFEISRLLHAQLLLLSNNTFALLDSFFTLCPYVHRFTPELVPLIESFCKFAILACRFNSLFSAFLMKKIALLQPLRGFFPQVADQLGQLFNLCQPCTYPPAPVSLDLTHQFLLIFSPGSDCLPPDFDEFSIIHDLKCLPVPSLLTKKFLYSLTDAFRAGTRRKRVLAYELVLQLLISHPCEVAPVILDPFLDILSDRDGELRSTALDYTPRYFPFFSKPSAKLLMLKLFSLGDHARTQLAHLYSSLMTHSLSL